MFTEGKLSTLAYFVVWYRTISKPLLITVYAIFATKEVTLLPVHTANVRYTRRGFDHFKVFQTDSTLRVTHRGCEGRQ